MLFVGLMICLGCLIVVVAVFVGCWLVGGARIFGFDGLMICALIVWLWAGIVVLLGFLCG